MVLRKERIFYLDELRAIAILLVLLAHTIKYFPVNIDYLASPTLLSYLAISRMGVPLFFMLSGALLLNKEYSISQFLKKRFSRVLIPAAFWYIILFLSVAYVNAFNFDLVSIWIYDAPFPWFVCAIIGIYLLMPVFNSFVKEHGTKGAEYFLFVWFIFIILINLHLTEEYYVTLIFQNFGVYMGYVVLGYYLTNKEFNIYSLPMAIFSSLIFIICLAINVYNAWNFTTIVYIESISIIIQCCALFLILRYLAKFASFNPKSALSKLHTFIEKSFIGTVIYLFSICSYTIYLMHEHIINLLSQYYPITSFDLVPVVFVLLAASSLIGAVLLSKIPILNKLVGVH
ncbi:acyltransferase [Methanobrevibacter sp.]|uniref:acyltransferase n=1 Tax=Methanobrevibacter sp. TaxID=66852 RepID=UPI00386E5F51